MRNITDNDCIFAMTPTMCKALIEKECRNCAFYKSSSEYEIVDGRARKKKVEPKGNTWQGCRKKLADRTTDIPRTNLVVRRNIRSGSCATRSGRKEENEKLSHEKDIYGKRL